MISDLMFGRDRAVVVQASSMSHNQESGLRFGNVRRDFMGALQQQLGHPLMAAHRLAVFPNLAARRGFLVRLIPAPGE